MCPRCDATVQPTWTYCRECGYAPEPVAEPDFGDAQDAIAVPPPEPAPGFGPSPGFGAAAAVPGAAADDAVIPSAGEPGDTLPPVAEDPVDGWASPSSAAFDAPAPSSFASGATPSASEPLGGAEPAGDGSAPGFGRGDAAGPVPPDSGAGERFDAAAFDPDALAGTPYIEEEVDAAPAAPAPIVFESAPPGPGLMGFESDPTPPRPPADVPGGGGSGSSPFSVNRVVAVVAIALGALILVGGILVLTGGGSKENVSTSAPGKTTPPPLGALTVSTSTIVDPLAPVSTTTVPVRDCDTITAMKSVDGADFTPCNGKFTIDFPGRPDTRLSDADLSMGKVTLNVHSSTSVEPPLPVRYLAGWAVLPKEPTQEEALEGMGALTAKMGCTLTNPMMFQDQPAYACKGAGDGSPNPENPTSAVGFTFVRGNMVYALASLSYENTQKQLETFANTFTPV